MDLKQTLQRLLAHIRALARDERALLSFSAGDTRKPEFIALNPRHQVPVLVHDDFTLYESGAIVEYLDEAFPGRGAPLFPGDAQRRALIRRVILEVDTALRMAEDAGLDLVEVAATARPPVVRIMDYGKYKFEMAKQARVAKKKQHVIELKEVKYRPGIDDHDFDTKTRHARRFLEEKNKVKVTMMFRGRQVAHPELGQAVLDRVSSSLADIGKIESAGRLEGKSMTMILTPK